MFNKLEAWLRRIIAEEVTAICHEVAKLDTSLEAERKKLVSAVSVHVKSTLNELEAGVVKVFEGKAEEIEKAFESEVAAAQRDLKKECEDALTAFRARIEQTFTDITNNSPSHWKADTDTVKAEQALRKAK